MEIKVKEILVLMEKITKFLQVNEHVCSLFSHDWRQKEIRETDRQREEG